MLYCLDLFTWRAQATEVAPSALNLFHPEHRQRIKQTLVIAHCISKNNTNFILIFLTLAQFDMVLAILAVMT